MITDIAEIVAALGLTQSLTTQEAGVINQIQGPVERSVKNLIRSNVEQATYTHLLPASNFEPLPVASLDYFDVTGGPIVPGYGGYGSGGSSKLQLMELPVRSVASVYEDRQAMGGQAPNGFPSTSLLTAGVNYYIDWETAGLCKNGQLIRRVSRWSTVPRSIKVTYTAGYTQAELDGNANDPSFQIDASPLKLAVLECIVASYNATLELQTGGCGPEKTTTIGDATSQFDETESGIKVVIPGAARIRLQPYVNYARLMG